jgi:hypothetical protein
MTSHSTSHGRPAHHARIGLNGALAGALAGALSASPPAQAQEFRLHGEAAAAVWLDQPQSDRFTPGFYGAVRPGVALGDVLSLQWSYALLAVPAGEEFSENGTAHFLTTGVRVRPLAPLRPPENQLGGLFADFDIGYVRTGPLDRLGLDAGLGYGFQVSDWSAVGPVVRYVHIVQPDGLQGAMPEDAQFLTLGLDFAFGPAHRAEAVHTCPTAPSCPEVAAAVQEEPGCRDYDRDGVCDAEDRCPTRIGPPATLGCPIDPCGGTPLVVLVQFPYDSATLPAPNADDPQTMDPVLDAVAEVIARDPSCRVCVVGHASSEGTDDYNQELSVRRASAVSGYLSARGLAPARIPISGMGARCQMVPASTKVLNRRVEFHRLGEGDSCPQSCVE